MQPKMAITTEDYGNHIHTSEVSYFIYKPLFLFITARSKPENTQLIPIFRFLCV